MEHDKIILDLLNRVMTLEERVSALENMRENMQSSELNLPAGSKKYRFLSDFLYESNQQTIKLTFSEIENILKFKLPESAVTHRAFWANTTSHSIALSWLSVDFNVVEVNLEERYVVFEKTRSFERIKIGKKRISTEEEYIYECENYTMLDLYMELKTNIFGELGNVETSATNDYISWKITEGRQFVTFSIQKQKICILTLASKKKYNIGEKVPDTHLWTLNYRTDIATEKDIEEVKQLILDSYNQVK